LEFYFAMDKISTLAVSYQIEGLKEAQNKKSALCFRCNETGHMARQCKNEVFCPRCKQRVHALRDCFRNRKVRQFNWKNDLLSQPETFDVNDSE